MKNYVQSIIVDFTRTDISRSAIRHYTSLIPRPPKKQQTTPNKTTT